MGKKTSELSSGNIARGNIVQEDFRVVKVHWILYRVFNDSVGKKNYLLFKYWTIKWNSFSLIRISNIHPRPSSCSDREPLSD